jgi:creatinine amidohydrolase
VAIAAAEAVAAAQPVAVLPGLWLGMSEHHLPFGGTITLDAATYLAVIGAVVRSLKAIGFQRLLIVNGHGGNNDALALAARELAAAHGLPIVTTMPWIMAPEAYGEILETPAPKHACEGEASLMLAIAPELVRTENFAAAVSNAAPPPALPRGVGRFQSFAERAPSTGTIGDPRLATAEKGEKLFAIHVRELVKVMRDETLWTAPDAVWTAGRGQGSTSAPVTAP